MRWNYIVQELHFFDLFFRKYRIISELIFQTFFFLQICFSIDWFFSEFVFWFLFSNLFYYHFFNFIFHWNYSSSDHLQVFCGHYPPTFQCPLQPLHQQYWRHRQQGWHRQLRAWHQRWAMMHHLCHHVFPSISHSVMATRKIHFFSLKINKTDQCDILWTAELPLKPEAAHDLF